MVDSSSERLDTRVVAAVGVILHIGDSRHPCMSRNISRGGIFVLSRIDIEEGAVLRVEIVHHGERLNCAARVTTVVDDGMGLAFVHTTPEFQQKIEDFIRALVRAPEGASPEGNVQVQAEWSIPDDDGGWGWFKKKKQLAELTSLSLDGAAIVSKKQPPVSTMILISLEGDDGEACQCEAEVVRRTDTGFAVRFVSPNMDFRRTITRLRKGVVV